MKTIRVVAAVIKNENKIFATARGYGEFKGQWEFPGGKIEAGETPQEALVREIKEELETTIQVEAESARWLSKEELYDVKWLPADILLIEKIMKNL